MGEYLTIRRLYSKLKNAVGKKNEFLGISKLNLDKKLPKAVEVLAKESKKPEQPEVGEADKQKMHLDDLESRLVYWAMEDPKKTLLLYNLLSEKNLEKTASRLIEHVKMNVFGSSGWPEYIETLLKAPESSGVLRTLFFEIAFSEIKGTDTVGDRDNRMIGPMKLLVGAGRFDDLEQVGIRIAMLSEGEMLWWINYAKEHDIPLAESKSRWNDKKFAQSAIVSWVLFQLCRAGRNDLAGNLADAARGNGVAYDEPAAPGSRKDEMGDDEKAELIGIVHALMEGGDYYGVIKLVESLIGLHGRDLTKKAILALMGREEIVHIATDGESGGNEFASARVRAMLKAAKDAFVEQGYLPEADDMRECWKEVFRYPMD